MEARGKKVFSDFLLLAGALFIASCCKILVNVAPLAQQFGDAQTLNLSFDIMLTALGIFAGINRVSGRTFFFYVATLLALLVYTAYLNEAHVTNWALVALLPDISAVVWLIVAIMTED